MGVFFFRTDVRRCMVSLRFLLVTVAVAAVCMASFPGDIAIAVQEGYGDFSSLQEVEYLLTFDKYKCVMTAALAALYAGSFAEDRKNHYLKYILCRVSLRRYVSCRLAVVLVGCIAASVAGFGLMSLLLSPWMGLKVVWGNIVAMRFLELASGRFAFLYLILLGVNFGMSAAVAAAVGMWITVYRQEGFLAVGGAVLAFYFLYAVSLVVPDLFSYSVIGSRFNQSEIASDLGLVLYHFAFLGLLFCGVGVLFYAAVKRRWKHGLLV